MELSVLPDQFLTLFVSQSLQYINNGCFGGIASAPNNQTK